MRLKGHRCFEHIYKNGIKYQTPLILLRVVEANPKILLSHFQDLKINTSRFAVAISNKVSKKAVTRNHLRRLIHDHLRKQLFHCNAKSNSWALISLKPASGNKEDTQLLKECDKLLCKAGFLR